MHNNKWIHQIVNLQQPDGSWGYFHSLSHPTKERPFTTEQALRRLWILGLRSSDEPLERAIRYMKGVLDGRFLPPDRREKVLNWDFFESMMMAAWIRRFVPGDEQALEIARFWAELIRVACLRGELNYKLYETEYRSEIPVLNDRERVIGIPQFYMVSLLTGVLDVQTERAFVDYLIANPSGIFYIYDGCIAEPPLVFASLRASRYIAALECLSGYRCAREKLGFAVDWLVSHVADGKWDMGSSVKDGVYFPVSDSWRRTEDRQRDCTERIEKLLHSIREVNP